MRYLVQYFQQLLTQISYSRDSIETEMQLILSYCPPWDWRCVWRRDKRWWRCHCSYLSESLSSLDSSSSRAACRSTIRRMDVSRSACNVCLTALNSSTWNSWTHEKHQWWGLKQTYRPERNLLSSGLLRRDVLSVLLQEMRIKPVVYFFLFFLQPNTQTCKVCVLRLIRLHTGCDACTLRHIAIPLLACRVQVFIYYLESRLSGHSCHLVVKLITTRNWMGDLSVPCSRGNIIPVVCVLFWRGNLRHTHCTLSVALETILQPLSPKLFFFFLIINQFNKNRQQTSLYYMQWQ